MNAAHPVVLAGIALGMFAGLTGLAAYLVYAERKILAYVQDRIGPNRVGPFGLLQPIADALKLLFKEDFTPSHVDRLLYTLAPMLPAIFGMTAFALMPFYPGWILADVPVALVMLFAMVSLGGYGVILAGWSSHSKYSLLGALRSAAQTISYELPIALAFASVIVLVGSLSLKDIVTFQKEHVWLVVPNGIGFILYLVGAFAETNRAPFDLPEAESELVAGYLTEYASMRWALFFLGEYINMTVASSLLTTFFLGGYLGPGPDGPWWFALKAGAILFLFMWVRATFPRFRYDQLMNLCWKVLVPLGILNLIWVTWLKFTLF